MKIKKFGNFLNEDVDYRSLITGDQYEDMSSKLTEITDTGWECWHKNSDEISFVNYDTSSIESDMVDKFIDYVKETYDISLYLDNEENEDDLTIIYFKIKN